MIALIKEKTIFVTRCCDIRCCQTFIFYHQNLDFIVFINIYIYDLYFIEFYVFIQQENTFLAVQKRCSKVSGDLELATQHLVLLFLVLHLSKLNGFTLIKGSIVFLVFGFWVKGKGSSLNLI